MTGPAAPSLTLTLSLLMYRFEVTAEQQGHMSDAGWLSMRHSDIASNSTLAVTNPCRQPEPGHQSEIVSPSSISANGSAEQACQQPQGPFHSLPEQKLLHFDEPSMCVVCLNYEVIWAENGEGRCCTRCACLALALDLQTIPEPETSQLSDLCPHEANSAPLSFLRNDDGAEYGYRAPEWQSVPSTGHVLTAAPLSAEDYKGQDVDMLVTGDGLSSSAPSRDDGQTLLSTPNASRPFASEYLYKEPKKWACDNCRMRKVRCHKKGPDDLCPLRVRSGRLKAPIANFHLQKRRSCSRGGLKCDYLMPCGRCKEHKKPHKCKRPSRVSPVRRVDECPSRPKAEAGPRTSVREVSRSKNSLIRLGVAIPFENEDTAHSFQTASSATPTSLEQIMRLTQYNGGWTSSQDLDAEPYTWETCSTGLAITQGLAGTPEYHPLRAQAAYVPINSGQQPSIVPQFEQEHLMHQTKLAIPSSLGQHSGLAHQLEIYQDGLNKAEWYDRLSHEVFRLEGGSERSNYE